MSRDLVMAIDIGSTGTKVICVDASGSIVASANTPIDSFSPRDGWVEHDPIQLWDSVVNCLGEIRNNVSSSRVAAVGITNQRETTVIWDRKTGVPVYNAISWQRKQGQTPVLSDLEEKDILRLSMTCSKMRNEQERIQSGFFQSKEMKCTRAKKQQTNCANPFPDLRLKHLRATTKSS